MFGGRHKENIIRSCRPALQIPGERKENMCFLDIPGERTDKESAIHCVVQGLGFRQAGW